MWFRGKHKFDLYLRYYPRNIADHQESQAWKILFPINIELIFISAFWFFTSKPPAYLFNGLLLLVWLIFFFTSWIQILIKFLVPILGSNLGSVITHLNGNTLNLCPISLSKLYHTLYSQIQYPPIKIFLTSHHLLTWQPVNGRETCILITFGGNKVLPSTCSFLIFRRIQMEISLLHLIHFFYLWLNNHLMTTSTQSLRKQNIMTETFSPCLMKQTKDVSPSIYK